VRKLFVGFDTPTYIRVVVWKVHFEFLRKTLSFSPHLCKSYYWSARISWRHTSVCVG
jgi:hypothetical protein